MLFKFIEKPITIDFFTTDPGAYHHAPVVKSNKMMPEWIKTVKSRPHTFGGNDNTIKQCNGFVDYFKNSYTIPLWSDVDIYIGEEGGIEYSYNFADRKSVIEHHPDDQRGDYLPQLKYQHLKFISPWAAVSNKSVNVHWTSPTWQIDSPEKMIILPAVVDYAYTHSTNINVIIPRAKEGKEFRLYTGQPMANLIPMTEKRVEAKCHLVDEKEFESIMLHAGSNTYFKNAINRHKANPNTCPFGFDRKSKKS